MSVSSVRFRQWDCCVHKGKKKNYLTEVELLGLFEEWGSSRLSGTGVQYAFIHLYCKQFTAMLLTPAPLTLTRAYHWGEEANPNLPKLA